MADYYDHRAHDLGLDDQISKIKKELVGPKQAFFKNLCQYQKENNNAGSARDKINLQQVHYIGLILCAENLEAANKRFHEEVYAQRPIENVVSQKTLQIATTIKGFDPAFFTDKGYFYDGSKLYAPTRDQYKTTKFIVHALETLPENKKPIWAALLEKYHIGYSGQTLTNMDISFAMAILNPQTFEQHRFAYNKKFVSGSDLFSPTLQAPLERAIKLLKDLCEEKELDFKICMQDFENFYNDQQNTPEAIRQREEAAHAAEDEEQRNQMLRFEQETQERKMVLRNRLQKLTKNDALTSEEAIFYFTYIYPKNDLSTASVLDDKERAIIEKVENLLSGKAVTYQPATKNHSETAIAKLTSDEFNDAVHFLRQSETASAAVVEIFRLSADPDKSHTLEDVSRLTGKAKNIVQMMLVKAKRELAKEGVSVPHLV